MDINLFFTHFKTFPYIIILIQSSGYFKLYKNSYLLYYFIFMPSINLSSKCSLPSDLDFKVRYFKCDILLINSLLN